jgi:predicted amidohydrolase
VSRGLFSVSIHLFTFSTVRTFYYSQGTQIYCAPTIDSQPEWQHTMIHIALEGRCFVLSACQYSQEKDYPPGHAVADENDRNPENVMVAGGSVIVSPLGVVLAGPLYNKEDVLTAELDIDDCVRGKFDLDVVGHYARPDSERFVFWKGATADASQFSTWE